MLDLCKGRSTCRGSTPPEGAAMVDDGAAAEASAASAAAFAALPQGCGHIQPKLRRIGLVLHLEYPEGKEEQVCARVALQQGGLVFRHSWASSF